MCPTARPSRVADAGGVASVVGRVVLAERLTCPVCGRRIFHTTARRGEVWSACRDSIGRAGDCPGHWLAIVLPPGSTGATLAAEVGPAAALTLLRAAFPELPASAFHAAEHLPLVAPDAERPCYLQLAVRRKDEHRYRFRPVWELLDALAVGRRAA